MHETRRWRMEILKRNELCTLEMEGLPSLPDFINLLLHNGYGTIIEPIFDENNKVINDKVLVTILDKQVDYD